MSTYIEYDNIGNMLLYRGRSFTWERGRNLCRIKDDNDLDINFKYDQNGNRILKSSERAIVHYHMDGDKIMAIQSPIGISMHFLYDQSGSPFAVRYKPIGTDVVRDFYYLYNLQGDVTGLIDTDGNQVVFYKYDSWGKLISKTDNSGCNLGYWNPFRYRGYCYDEETGYYYLKSRYYGMPS